MTNLTRSSSSAAPGQHDRLGQLLKLVVGVALLGYPVAIYLVRDRFTAGQLLAGLLALLGLRALVTGWITGRRRRLYALVGVVLLLAAGAIGALQAAIDMRWLRFYPMLFDLAVAAAFLGSLWIGKPLVERIASAFHAGPLDARVVRYARHVTEAWGALMILIALVSLGTALAGSLRAWSLFNGVIVYVVLVLAFAAEYALRRYLRWKWSRT